MSYSIPVPNANQFQVNGVNYCIGALDIPLGPISSFVVAVFELKSDGWNMIEKPIVNLPSGALDAVQKVGGKVKYVQQVKAALQAFLNRIFSAPAATVPAASATEPTTDAEAVAAIIAGVMGFKVTVVNGIPTVG